MQKLEVARILMNDVNFLIGNENIINAPLPTFSGEICEFLNDLSKEIMQSPESRLYPDLYSLGFWCRKGNIQKIKENYANSGYRLGKGLCFHIAPSNIPINFAIFLSFFASCRQFKPRKAAEQTVSAGRCFDKNPQIVLSRHPH